MKEEYVHGDYNVISDRSGFKHKRSDMRFEWTNSLVHKDDWERRHPQDFLKGVRDHQAVDDPRPGATDTFANVETTLDAAELADQTVLSVTSTSNMVNGDTIIVFMDNDIAHLSTISSFVADDTVTIADGLTHKASSGNAVIIFHNVTQSSDL